MLDTTRMLRLRYCVENEGLSLRSALSLSNLNSRRAIGSSTDQMWDIGVELGGMNDGTCIQWVKGLEKLGIKILKHGEPVKTTLRFGERYD